jgi:succinate-semialdehyde dehydrogenase/glutarate-semialdehyde dehydrogenase
VETIAVVDPATGEETGRIPAGSAEAADAAVAAARGAYPGWRDLPLDARSALVADGVKRLRGALDELAAMQAREMGQPVSVAREMTEAGLAEVDDLLREAAAFPWVAPLPAPDGATATLHRVPYGVGALITPWNFPLPTSLAGLAALLLAGSTVVWKPSERSPFSAHRAAELLDLPAGVLTVLDGDGRAGAPLAEHPDVGIVVFTGSAPVGRSIGAVCGRLLRPALLELGGKDPVVVDADVDPAWAAEQVAQGAFLNTGQICTSMERVYVHREIADAFVAALVARAEALVVGYPADPATEIGPLVDERQRAVVERHVADATARGARVLTGGAAPDRPGWWYPPTVVVDVPDDCALMTEETFGPVAPVRVVESFEEGVALAARSDYGLGATVLTNDPAHAELANTIPTGLLWVNEWWGGAAGMRWEPAGASGLGAAGGLESVTRVFSRYAVSPRSTAAAP